MMARRSFNPYEAPMHTMKRHGIGSRIVEEERTFHAGMEDPHREQFDGHVERALASPRLRRAAAERGFGGTGNLAGPGNKRYEDLLSIRAQQAGTSKRELERQARAEAKAKAPEHDEPVDVDDDDYGLEDVLAEDDEWNQEWSEIAVAVEDAEEWEDEDEVSSSPPQFVLPPSDRYAALVADHRLSDDQIGNLMVEAQNDPSLTSARKFELSQQFGRLLGARVGV